MIIRMLSAGKSFKGLGQYLTHDPNATTDERVAWTHTLNLANDHVPSAIDEMYLTAENAELLKQEAGIRAGGRPNENPVKHFSLNWSPEENPTRDHMIETTEDFLRHMKWDEHQALLVAHEDKAHSHVHVMLNTVNPETGLKLDDGFEQRRAQKWALGYELEQGKIYCEQRLENAADRDAAPTRPVWLAFENSRKEFERDENTRKELSGEFPDGPENRENAKSLEWQALKELQRNERTTFFTEGKSAFSELRKSIYLDVREEFRSRWADYFEAVKSGGNSEELGRYKADLVAEQSSSLDTRRDAACAELRSTRDGAYRELLSDQSELRAGMRWRQEAGLDCSQFLKLAEEGGFSKSGELTAAFRDSADEVTMPFGGRGRAEEPADAPRGAPAGDSGGMRSGADVSVGLGLGFAFGLGSVADSIADGLVGGSRAPRSKQREAQPSGPNPFDAAANEAGKARERSQEEDADWRRRQEERYWE
ncbi:MAG: relaxase/mobilization nuclease domain-containing protein [Devosia sp.]|nr:relaxase/mobilization nuclease domain-containing protein [Devosia sp.]